MKKVLAGLLMSLSLFASAGTIHYISTDGAVKIDIINLPEGKFYNGQVFKYSFISKKGNDLISTVTIVSANEGVTNGVMDGNLTLMFGKNPLLTGYKARFDETGSLIKFRLEYQGVIMTFKRLIALNK